MKTSEDILSGLPAEQHIRDGLADIENGRESISACLVRIACPRLLKAGILKSPPLPTEQDAELTLYELLRPEGKRAYSVYNSLLRELVSFEQALDHRLKEA